MAQIPKHFRLFANGLAHLKSPSIPVGLKNAWRWLTRPTRIFGMILFVFGLPGFLENIRGWSTWLNNIFQFLGSISLGPTFEWAMKVLDHPWVYWGLLFIGATCFFQADRIGQAIHRIRGRIDYMVAVQMGHENFISEVDAVRLIMNSQWAQARRARNEKPRSIFDSVPLSTLQSDPARDARNRMFSTWCRLALSRFDMEEKESIKEVGGKKEYDEVRLRTWLTGKYHEDITEEFGPI